MKSKADYAAFFWQQATEVNMKEELIEALRRLEVTVNNIRYCWEKRPENMWKAMQQAESDCDSARAAISKALGEE
ncbi:hypothetical protein [Enterobacter kobei]